MKRRHVLAVLTPGGVVLAGCSRDSNPDSTTDQTPVMTQTETDPNQRTAQPPDGNDVQPDALVALYDFAYDLYRQGLTQFDDGLSMWEGGSSLQATKQFAYTQQRFADSNSALVRVTNRLTDAGVGGFRIADDARTRTERLESAANNYVGASVASVEGESDTAANLAENAETFRRRADNHTFEEPSAFESSLRSSL